MYSLDAGYHGRQDLGDIAVARSPPLGLQRDAIQLSLGKGYIPVPLIPSHPIPPTQPLTHLLTKFYPSRNFLPVQHSKCEETSMCHSKSAEAGILASH